MELCFDNRVVIKYQKNKCYLGLLEYNFYKSAAQIRVFTGNRMLLLLNILVRFIIIAYTCNTTLKSFNLCNILVSVKIKVNV